MPVIGRNAPGNSRSYSFKKKAKKAADAKAAEGSSGLESFGFYVKKSDTIEKQVSERLSEMVDLLTATDSCSNISRRIDPSVNSEEAVDNSSLNGI